jgi:5-(carboxyamino)imidazole ribonucleotide mutase
VKPKKKNNKVAIIMGSQSDHSIMKECAKILETLKIKHQVLIVSAHRTPKRMFEFADNAQKNGFAVIIAGAGGSAHLPGMVASLSSLPVIGVPIESKKLKGLDSLLSIAQMPKGCPVATMAINGSFNAGLLAASIIGTFDDKVKTNLDKWKRLQTKSVKKKLSN